MLYSCSTCPVGVCMGKEKKNACIELFRKRLSEQMCTRQSRKPNMGYDQYTREKFQIP